MINNQKKRIKISAFVLTVLLCFSLLGTTSASAEGNGSLTFDVQPVGNSVTNGYFVQDATPGKPARVTVRLKNLRATPVTLIAEGRNAMTSLYGGVQYVDYEKNSYVRLLDAGHAMKPRISGEKQITLGAFEQKQVTYTIASPSDAYGAQLGGLSFRTTSSPNERIVAVQLTYPPAPKPHVTLGAPSLTVTPSGPYLFFDLENEKAALNKNVAFDYVVYKDGAFYFKKKSTGAFKMAPMSAVRYPSLWEKDSVEPGDYKIVTHVTGDGQNETKTFPIQVTKKESEQSKETPAYQTKHNPDQPATRSEKNKNQKSSKSRVKGEPSDSAASKTRANNKSKSTQSEASDRLPLPNGLSPNKVPSNGHITALDKAKTETIKHKSSLVTGQTGKPNVTIKNGVRTVLVPYMPYWAWAVISGLALLSGTLGVLLYREKRRKGASASEKRKQVRRSRRSKKARQAVRTHSKRKRI